MDIDALELEALKLPAEDRARLVRDLLDSLDELSAEELDRLWLEEASQRAAQIDAGEVELIPAEEVDRKARALLRWPVASTRRRKRNTSDRLPSRSRGVKVSADGTEITS